MSKVACETDMDTKINAIMELMFAIHPQSYGESPTI